MAIGGNLSFLEEKIGYKFNDIKLLEIAMTHSSYANEKKNQGITIDSNERMEFLGDAVLEIVISEYLFDNYQKYSEGVLTKMRQNIVCEKTLYKVALEISLGEHINLGRGEEQTDCRNRPKILANAVEALFAAIYIDSSSRGNEKYKSVVLALMASEIDSSFKMQYGDCKTLLQEIVDKDRGAILEYEVESELGPEHNKSFTVICKVNNNLVGRGSAQTKKEAEMEAAKDALLLFGVNL